MERLKRPESRRMAQPLASVEAFEGFEGFEGFKGFEGFEAFEGQFRATRKKGFGAPEPRAHSLRNSAHSLAPTVWQVRGFGASEASRIQKLAAPTASMAHSLAQSPEPTV